MEYAKQQGVPLAPLQSSSQRARNFWGSQTSNSKPLIPEFRDFVYPTEATTEPGYRLLASPPTGAPTTDLQEGEADDLDMEDPQDQCEEEVKSSSKRRRQTYKYGIQWSPENFFEKAKNVDRPKDPQSALPFSLKEALCQVLGNSPAEVAKFRFQVTSAIRSKAAELEVEEAQLKASMDASTARVLKSKRPCLWKHLLETASFSDMGVVDLVKDGIPLYGIHSEPPNFPADWRPASLSVTELLGSSVWRRKPLMGTRGAETDESTMEDLHASTMKEVELGHLHDFFGANHWLFNPRFALYQGTEAKIRAIDDGKRPGLNLAYTANFKLELFDVDTLAALIACVTDSLQAGSVELELKDKAVSVPINSQVKQDTWLGRALDLSRAYKQLAIDPKPRLLNVIGCFFSGERVFFRCDVLQFGALAAVYSFNRVSRSIHHLICTLLWGLSTCFYDDFPTISPAETSSLLSKSMGILLTLLGWDHAKVGTKAIDFASVVNALGISVQLSSVNRGSFILCNKEGRIQKLCSMLGEIKLKGSITKAEAAQIQGHLNFASGFFISKALRFLVASFARLADVPKILGKSELGKLCDLMRPRQYAAETLKNPVIIFTDGAWESGRATGGAVVYDTRGGEAMVFSVRIPVRLFSVRLEDVGDQLISQIEFFVYLALRYSMAEQLCNRLGIAWIDNEAARYVAIKGSSHSFSMVALCRVLQQIELERPSSAWLERVASFSNPSDMPSRDQVELAAKLLNARSTEELRVPDHLVGAIISLHRDP